MEIKRIFVIESVFDNALLHDAGDYFEAQISPLCNAKGIAFERIPYYSLRDIQDALKHIKDSCSPEGATIIHIICHGIDSVCYNGLAYKVDPRYFDAAKKLNISTDYMCHAWEALRSDLEQINILTDGNLFLSMCVCHGAKIFDTCKLPFAKFIIASNDELHLDDIKQTFVDVYNELISSSDMTSIEKVIESANQRNNGRSQLALYEEMQKLL